jgi:hypothetical protein
LYRLDDKSSVDFVGEDFLGEGFIEAEIETIEQIAEAFSVATQECGIQGVLVTCYRSAWDGVKLADGDIDTAVDEFLQIWQGALGDGSSSLRGAAGHANRLGVDVPWKQHLDAIDGMVGDVFQHVIRN